jgi:hypothetical protein
MATGLNILEEGNTLSPLQCEVRHETELMPGNTDDDKFTVEAGKMNAVIITYDRDFKEVKSKWPLYRKHKVGVVFFRSYKDILRYWDIVVSFINHWEKLKHEVNENNPPFVFEITLKGISKLM